MKELALIEASSLETLVIFLAKYGPNKLRLNDEELEALLPSIEEIDARRL